MTSHTTPRPFSVFGLSKTQYGANGIGGVIYANIDDLASLIHPMASVCWDRDIGYKYGGQPARVYIYNRSYSQLASVFFNRHDG